MTNEQKRVAASILPLIIVDGKLRGCMKSTEDDPRAYYVWRYARFHGGKDTRWPVLAEMGVRHESEEMRNFLHALAETAAKRYFGTDMGAAAAWSGAL